MAWGVERVGDEGLVSRSGWWGGRERRRHRFQVKVKERKRDAACRAARHPVVRNAVLRWHRRGDASLSRSRSNIHATRH